MYSIALGNGFIHSSFSFLVNRKKDTSHLYLFFFPCKIDPSSFLVRLVYTDRIVVGTISKGETKYLYVEQHLNRKNKR